MGTGVPSGLQIHGGALEGSQVGSIPTHSLHFFKYEESNKRYWHTHSHQSW